MEDYEVTQQVFEKLVEEKTFDPLYVTHVPKELVPLAKQNADDDSLVDVYELIINGQEISPGYSELNDPDIQRKRLLDQAGEETQKVDEEIRERANLVIKRVNLINANEKYPDEISGGMKKRVAIARAIVMNPKYLFCDEPNSGLDPKTAILIDNLIHS